MFRPLYVISILPWTNTILYSCSTFYDSITAPTGIETGWVRVPIHVWGLQVHIACWLISGCATPEWSCLQVGYFLAGNAQVSRMKKMEDQDVIFESFWKATHFPTILLCHGGFPSPPKRGSAGLLQHDSIQSPITLSFWVLLPSSVLQGKQ